METLLAIIILLGLFTLFGWRGLTIIGKILGFIGAAIITSIISLFLYLLLRNMEPWMIAALMTFESAILLIAVLLSIPELEKKEKEESEKEKSK